MYGSELGYVVFRHLLELACWSLTDWALLWCLLAFVDIATNGADKFLLHNVSCMFLYLKGLVGPHRHLV